MSKEIRGAGGNESRELKQGRFGFFLEPSLRDELRVYAANLNVEMSEVARRAIANEIRGTRPDASTGTDTFRGAYLSRVPCGPWAEAVDSSDSFTISDDAADELEARPGDVWVRAEGQSMEAAGIGDGFLVLMRPLAEGRTPRRGEIALVQVFLDEGEGLGNSGDCALATIKYWHPPTGTAPLPTLLDAAGQPFALPPGVVRVVPVAVARGVLGRL